MDERFKNDVFTFVRIEYDSFGAAAAVAAAGSGGGRGGGGYGGGRWATDWPDSDLNFSFRLQQLTSLKVNPDPISHAADRRAAVRLSVHLHDRAGRPRLLRGRGRGPAAVSAQRRLPDGRRLLGRRPSWDNSTSRSSARLPQTASPRSCRSSTRSSGASIRLKEKPQVPSIHAWGGPGAHLGRPRRQHAAGPLQGHLRRQGPDDGRSSATTPTSATAGSGKAKTPSISTSSPRRRRTRWASTS